MSTMQDQPEPQPQPTSEQLQQLVQQAANAVVQQLMLKNRDVARGSDATKARIDELDARNVLFQLHLDMLSRLMIEKGLITGDDLNKHLIAAFATHANDLAGHPQLVLPKGRLNGH